MIINALTSTLGWCFPRRCFPLSRRDSTSCRRTCLDESGLRGRCALAGLDRLLERQGQLVVRARTDRGVPPVRRRRALDLRAVAPLLPDRSLAGAGWRRRDLRTDAREALLRSGSVAERPTIGIDQREPNNPIGRFVPQFAVACASRNRPYGPLARYPGPIYGTGPVNLRASLLWGRPRKSPCDPYGTGPVKRSLSPAQSRTQSPDDFREGAWPAGKRLTVGATSLDLLLAGCQDTLEL